MNNKMNVFKILALTGTVMGFVATLISDYANGREQEKLIEEKIDEALAKREEKES